MNFKRKKSKRSPRCTMCTKYSWWGNHKERRPVRDHAARQAKLQEPV